MKANIGLGVLACGMTIMGSAALPARAQTDPSPAHPAYVVYDTGTLGGAVGVGNSINDIGWIGGLSTTAAGATHAALWSPGRVIDLGTLGGANSAVEWPVKNNHGLVVGISESARPDPNGEKFSCDPDFIATHGHTCLPFLWRNGTIVQLPLLGGNNGFATGINNSGQAVGWAETALHDPTCVPPQVLQFEAVLWGPGVGQQRILPPFPGDSTSAATAINDAGEVVGISGDCGDAVGAFSARHALLWENGHPMRLPTLGGRGWNTPMAINNAGAVAGFSDLSGDVSGGVLRANFQAFLWTREGGIRNLHTLPGDVLSEATGINDFGQIAGTSFDANGNSRVFLWQDGVMYDLNSLVQPDAPLYLLASGDINGRGVITGLACVVAAGACSSVLHTFVAIVAPAVAAAAAPGGAGAAVRPAVPAEVRARVLQQQRLGRMTGGN